MRLIGAMMLAISLLLAGAGCASSEGPSELAIPGGDYSAAFDAAIAAARDEGFIATALDRRAGTIETESANASSILEPWHGDNASAAQAWENTMQHQRRRVRFEFAPADEMPPELPPPGELPGANVFGDAEVAPDLTIAPQPLTLRAFVIVERAHTPGERLSAWSRRYVTQTRFGSEDADLPLSFWEPVGRDVAFERRLLARVERLLRPSADSAQPRP